MLSLICADYAGHHILCCVGISGPSVTFDTLKQSWSCCNPDILLSDMFSAVSFLPTSSKAVLLYSM